MINAHAFWRNSTGSKSKQHDNVPMQNWNVILLNLISFLHLVAPTEKSLYGCYWDPTPERRVPWGYVDIAWMTTEFLYLNLYRLARTHLAGTTA